MELVYLWVENYKNIDHQGFNFSPRFHCEYNDETKELTIKENDDYIPDFFGKNINVTAIVGKNGSGKSSLLDQISIFGNLIPASSNKILGFLSNTQISEKIGKSFLLFYDKNEDMLIQEYGKKLKIIFCKKEKEYRTKILHEQFTLNYNFMLENRHEYYFYNYDFNENRLFVQPKKDNNILDFGLIDKESNKFLLFNILEFDEKIELIDDFFIPYSAELKVNQKLYLELEKYGYTELSRKVTYFQEDKILEGRKKYTKFTLDDLKLLNAIFIVLDIDEKVKYSFSKDDYKLNESYKNIYQKNNFQEKVNYILNNTYDDVFNNDIPYIKKDFRFIENSQVSYISNSKYLLYENIELIKSLPNWIDIILFNNKGVSFISLSNGEKFTIRFIYNLIFFLNKIKKEDCDFINILLDEIDIGLHPQWQKKFFNAVINVLKNYTKYLNIIFSTHSPFLLSDIPKQNIIFLDTYKKEDREVKKGEQKVGNCKVLSHDKVLSKKQTFGANIHTLLSDSFFMEDGLMGEFAKGKIIQIKKFHKKVLKYQENKKVKKAYICFYNKKQKEFEHIQSIIGEPFLKTVIKNYLDEVENILFDDAKAKEMAIKRLVKEFDKDDIMKVLNG